MVKEKTESKITSTKKQKNHKKIFKKKKIIEKGTKEQKKLEISKVNNPQKRTCIKQNANDANNTSQGNIFIVFVFVVVVIIRVANGGNQTTLLLALRQS